MTLHSFRTLSMSLSFSDLTKRLFRQLTKKALPPSRPTNRFRPMLESLDARVVPAAYFWTGAVSSDATNILNWNDGTRVPLSLPDADDDVTIGYGSRDCDGLVSNGSATSFLSLHILSGYSGTVTLGESLSVGVYEQTGAALSQPTSGRDLTVTNEFTWTGGTLNSSNYLANVTLDGATGLIEPAGGGTVNLGSNFKLSNSAVATMKEGTINITNDGMVFEVNQNCGMMADPGLNKEIVVAASPGLTLGPDIQIKAGAWVEVRSGTYSNDGRVENHGGKFTLKADTEAFFKGFQGVEAGYYQSLGSTFLHGGSTLSVGTNKNVTFQGGTLQTVEAGTSSTSWVTIQVGFLLRFESGDIYINSGPGVTSFGNDYGTLRVVGKVSWSGGTFHARVPAEHNGWDADLWYATGTFDMYKLQPTSPGPQLAPVPLSDENDPTVPTTGFTWKILQADGGITAAQGLTMYDGNLWAHDAVGNNPVTQWKLRAK
jgi:hypothetical protein